VPDLPVAPEELEECRRLIGVWLRRRHHIREASDSAVRRWTRAIGDRNPLFLDHGYARQSAVGHPVAPPCFLYAVDDTVVALKFPHLHVIYGGTRWEFYRWLRIGEEVTSRARLVDLQVKEGRFCGPMILQVGEVLYLDGQGQPVARALSHVLRTSREEAVRRGKYASLKKHRYQLEELFAVEDAYDGEVIRGADVRYWEEVQEGEELPPIVKGPLTSEEVIQFICATRPAPAFRRFVEERRRHPGIAFRDPQSGMWNSWEASLLDDRVAQRMGFPAAHDCGLDRISWVGQLLTNWMSDAGFLRRLEVRLLRPNLYGDATWCHGRVRAKERHNGQGVVLCDVWCRDQRGETTARGTAEVLLPTRQVKP